MRCRGARALLSSSASGLTRADIPAAAKAAAMDAAPCGLCVWRARRGISRSSFSPPCLTTPTGNAALVVVRIRPAKVTRVPPPPNDTGEGDAPHRARDHILFITLAAPGGAVVIDTSADAVAAAVPDVIAAAVASAVASAVARDGGAEERGTEAGGTAPTCGCKTLVVTVAAAAPAKGVGAGSGTNGVVNCEGNDNTIVASFGAGTGT